MDLNAADVLSRTTLLIALDFFNNEVAIDDVLDGLLSTSVLIVADEQDLSSPAGQTALVALVTLVARLGIGIDLDIPDVPVLGPQPPLCQDGSLRVALQQHAGLLVPGSRFDAGCTPHAIYALGSSGRRVGARATAVKWDAASCQVGPIDKVASGLWAGGWPIGALAAGGAAASDVFRLAVARIAQRVGRKRPAALRPHGTDVIALRLGPSPPSTVDLGAVDFVSAGAITHSSLFALLRIPSLVGTARVFDDDLTDQTNLNRYELLRANEIGVPKVELLQQFTTPIFSIAGVFDRYAGQVSLANRVLVGADDIPTRWLVQAGEPQWLGVGATGHLLAVVSTHQPSGPCAGCAHDHDDVAEGGQPIPTVSVVSYWAGLMLAAELLEAVTDGVRPGRLVTCFPTGLGGRTAHIVGSTQANPRCPVGCLASRGMPN